MKKLNEVDLFVSRRVRELRLAKGVTQSALATCLGVSPQQVQKYEDWSDRVGAGRLFQIATCLDVSVQEFFPPSDRDATAPGQINVDKEILRILSDPKSMQLHRLFRDITDEGKRDRLIAHARELVAVAQRNAGASGPKPRQAASKRGA